VETPSITEETRADFAATYDRLKKERFGPGVVTEEQELQFVEELIRQAEAGDVAHNGVIHHIVPAEINYLDEATLAATQPPRGLTRPQIAIVGALVAAFLGYVGLTLVGGLTSSTASITPTPTTTPLVAHSVLPATATPTAVPPTAVAGFPSTVNGERLPLVRPTTLELAGRSFLAYVAPVHDNNWAVNGDPGLANWVPGATINWSFALYLDTDPSAAAWLPHLNTPITATVRVSDGRAQRFQLTEKATIQRTQTEVLDPHWAGLTVVIRAAPGDERLLLRGAEIAPMADMPVTLPAEGGVPTTTPP
jgi:hypothetical protein